MPEILKTINYFQFKLLEGNRLIDIRDVNALAAKIQVKNLLHLCPILVNSAMGVVEGQHRLKAAEKLGVYVYYIVSDDIDASDMALLNSAQKNWKINDYINYWTVNKRTGFEVMSDFMVANPLMPPSTVMMMLSPTYNRNLDGLRRGELDTSNIEQAQHIAAMLREYAELIGFAYERNFILAVMRCVKNVAYDHEHMKGKLSYQRRGLYRCVSVQHYCDMLAEIYNHSVSSKNHIKF